MPESPARAAVQMGIMLVRLPTLLAIVAFSAAPGAGEDWVREFEEKVQPFLTAYRTDCHDSETRKGDLSLVEDKTVAAIAANRAVWVGVMRNIQWHTMPPPKKPKPSLEERATVAGWFDRLLFPVNCANPDPGPLTFRRLSRGEYANSLRDLLGVEVPEISDLPADDTGYGFDNIGDVLSISPLHVEKYLSVAERAVDRALPTAPDQPPVLKIPARRFKGGRDSEHGSVYLYQNGTLTAREELPAGRYRIRVKAAGDQAGDEPARAILRVGDEVEHAFEVPEEPDNPREHVVEARLPGGRTSFRVEFINDVWFPDEPNRRRRDRNLHIFGLTVEGPLDPPPPSETQKQLLAIAPDLKDDDARTTAVLRRWAGRAYRRAPTKEELDRLLDIARAARELGATWEESVKAAMTASLVSPSFLFRETPAPGLAAGVHPVADMQLAARLSYFLWSTTPDDRLLERAAAGRLRAGLREEVARMLADPRARALTEDFAGQWLQLRSLAVLEPDPKVFPDFSPGLREAMSRETNLLFDEVRTVNRSVVDLLTADHTFVNETLARHYGIDGVEGAEFRRVSLAGTPRRGMLTHGSILTLTSLPTRTSPVVRGKWVLENILGTEPPPAPQNIPQLGERREFDPASTLRQRLQIHRDDPACASCHAILDPPGFVLEHFNGIGAWRELDDGLPIDSSAELVTGETYQGHHDYIDALAGRHRRDFARSVVEKLLIYALGRGLLSDDRCAVNAILDGTAAGGYRFHDLIQGVVSSHPFLHHRVPPPPAVQTGGL